MSGPNPWNAGPGELSQDEEFEERTGHHAVDECDRCDGLGWVRFKRWGPAKHVCPVCNGNGLMPERPQEKRSPEPEGLGMGEARKPRGGAPGRREETT